MAAATESTTMTSGSDARPSTPPAVESQGPISGQSEGNEDPFKEENLADVAGSEDMKEGSTSPGKDRRMSKEWDTSKVPPSQFQRRKGSIYATPGSRDGHVKGSERDKAYFDKLKEKGWGILKKTKS